MTTNWVIKYKNNYETDTHWNLKRDFLLANEGKFPEERLVSLSHVFVNTRLLGCSYSATLMALVEELSKDITCKFDVQQNKLKRTLISGQVAAAAKIKKNVVMDDPLVSSEEGMEAVITPINLAIKANKKNVNINSLMELDISRPTCISKTNPVYENTTKFKTPSFKKIEFVKSSHGNDKPPPELKTPESELMVLLNHIKNTTEPFGHIVLFSEVGDKPIHFLMRVCNPWSKSFQRVFSDEKNAWCARIMLNKFEIGVAFDQNKIVARSKAIEIAMKNLSAHYYTVLVKCRISLFHKVEDVVENCKIGSSEIKKVPDDPGPEEHVVMLDDNNIGSKMLKVMGWSGGGLGKNEQGISEPVMVTRRIDRACIGLNIKNTKTKNFLKTENTKRCRNSLYTDPLNSFYFFNCDIKSKLFKVMKWFNNKSTLHIYVAPINSNDTNNNMDNANKENGTTISEIDRIKNIILDFKNSNDFSDLVFSPEFTKSQRAIFHVYAQSLGLLTKSYLKKDRYLVISKDPDHWTVINELVKNAAKFKWLYEILPPTQKKS